MEPQNNEERIEKFNPVFLCQQTLGDHESGEDTQSLILLNLQNCLMTLLFFLKIQYVNTVQLLFFLLYLKTPCKWDSNLYWFYIKKIFIFVTYLNVLFPLPYIVKYILKFLYERKINQAREERCQSVPFDDGTIHIITVQ